MSPLLRIVPISRTRNANTRRIWRTLTMTVITPNQLDLSQRTNLFSPIYATKFKRVTLVFPGVPHYIVKYTTRVYGEAFTHNFPELSGGVLTCSFPKSIASLRTLQRSKLRRSSNRVTQFSPKKLFAKFSNGF